MRTAAAEKKGSVRPPDWSSIGASGHAVQFYPTDGHLLDLLSRFVGTALVTGDVAIVVATREHRDGLAARLKGRGFNLNVARRQGRYISLDAAATLEKISRDGIPDEALFREVVGGLMAKLHARGERPKISAFGEMVALLWAAGRPEAAIRLEQMWNVLATEYRVLPLLRLPDAWLRQRPRRGVHEDLRPALARLHRRADAAARLRPLERRSTRSTQRKLPSVSRADAASPARPGAVLAG